ncbi:MAG: protein kinase [Planctomycetaceae bacterium]
MPRPKLKHPTKEMLVSYGLGKLDDTSTERVEKHLENCNACLQVVSDQSSDSFLLKLQQVQKPLDAANRKTHTGMDSTSIEKQPAAELIAPVSPEFKTTNIISADLVNIPNYEVIQELGRGGMGVVYLARNLIMNRLEALKVINGALLARPGAADRFLREIQSAAKLNHTNVVSAYNAFQTEDQLVFAMEYIDGPNLGDLIDPARPFSVNRACYFIMQAATGLQHAHENELIHRDIKPGNLICYRQGKKWNVKLLDFGLAKILSEQGFDETLTQEGVILGTPSYIAPEQTLKAQNADIRSDIYSLGCTLYCLLAGRPPFTGDNAMEVLQAHHLSTAEPLNQVRPDVPSELAAIVAKMMAKSPEDRFQKPEEVAKGLKAFVKPAGQTSKTEPELSLINQPAEPSSLSQEVFVLPEHPEFSPTRALKLKTQKVDSQRMWIAGGAGLLLLAFLIAWGMGLLSIRTRQGLLVLENVPSGSEVYVDGEKVL